VGAIISKLELEGILDQTLIIFTSDNGGLDKPETLANGHDSNLGLRGKKGSIHEG
jgi:arylsulfatase A-like enzyme